MNEIMIAEPIPKSKRCTSRCPARGYIGCEKARHHLDGCAGGGFTWRRGYGHARPVLLSRPEWDPAPEPRRGPCDGRIYDRSPRGRQCPNQGRRITLTKGETELRFTRCQSHWPELSEEWTIR